MAYNPNNKLGVKVIPYDPNKKKEPTNTQLAQGSNGSAGIVPGDASGEAGYDKQTNVDKAKAVLGITPPVSIGNVGDLAEKAGSVASSIYKAPGAVVEGVKSMLTQSSQEGMRPPGFTRPSLASTVTNTPVQPAKITAPTINRPTLASPSSLITSPELYSSLTPLTSEPIKNTIDNKPIATRLGGLYGGEGSSVSITRPDGSNPFTPAQEDSLNKTLAREADPAFKARLAEQARIVDERTKGNELARLESKYKDARRRNDPVETKMYEAMILNEQDNSTSRLNTQTASETSKANNTLSQKIEARKQMGTEALDQDKQDQLVYNKVIDNINTLNKEGAPTPRDIYSQTDTVLGSRPFTYSLFKQVHKDIPEEATSSKEGLAAFLNEAGYDQKRFNEIMNSSGF